MQNEAFLVAKVHSACCVQKLQAVDEGPRGQLKDKKWRAMISTDHKRAFNRIGGFVSFMTFYAMMIATMSDQFVRYS